MTNHLTIRAHISLLPPTPGGATYFRTGIRPNHNMGGPDDSDFDIGEIRFLDRMSLNFGEGCNAIVSFIPRPGLADRLTPGQKWRIQSVRRLVGEGTVLSSETFDAFLKLVAAQQAAP